MSLLCTIQIIDFLLAIFSAKCSILYETILVIVMNTMIFVLVWSQGSLFLLFPCTIAQLSKISIYPPVLCNLLCNQLTHSIALRNTSCLVYITLATRVLQNWPRWLLSCIWGVYLSTSQKPSRCQRTWRGWTYSFK